MAFISSELATAQVRRGISDFVVELRVDDVHTGQIGEVNIAMTFKEDTPIEQVIADRDLVRDSFYKLAVGVAEDDLRVSPYFKLDMVRRNQPESEPTIAE